MPRFTSGSIAWFLWGWGCSRRAPSLMARHRWLFKCPIRCFHKQKLNILCMAKTCTKKPYTKPCNTYVQHIKKCIQSWCQLCLSVSNYIINQLTTKKSTQVHWIQTHAYYSIYYRRSTNKSLLLQQQWTGCFVAASTAI